MESRNRPLGITLLFTPGCAGREPTERRVRDILARRRLSAHVKVVLVENAEQARALRFPGSPTVRINGRDLEPEADRAFQFGLG